MTDRRGSLRVLDVRPGALEPGTLDLLSVRVLVEGRPDGVHLVGDVVDQFHVVTQWSAGTDRHAVVMLYAVVRGRHGLGVTDGDRHVPLLVERRDAPTPPEPLPAAEVHVAMAAYAPSRDRFHRQIQSLRDQTHRDWHCLVSVDAGPDAAVIDDVVDGDPRFTVRHHRRNVGFYRNFERALRAARANCTWVALSDDDDRWEPDKLDTLTRSIGSCAMVASTVVVVDDHCDPIAGAAMPRLDVSDPLRVATCNSVVGMSSLVRAELLDHALPFPDLPGRYHDKWLALSALASGAGIATVERPLTAYVQHDRNVHGANWRHETRWSTATSTVRHATRSVRAQQSGHSASRAPDLAELMLAAHRGVPSSPLMHTYRLWRDADRRTRASMSLQVARADHPSAMAAGSSLMALDFEQRRARSHLTTQELQP